MLNGYDDQDPLRKNGIVSEGVGIQSIALLPGNGQMYGMLGYVVSSIQFTKAQ